MRVIRGPYANFTTSLPGVPGGEHIVFENYLATVSEQVAEAFLTLYSGKFHCERHYNPGPADKVLIVRDLGLGDVLMVTPTIRALKKSGVGQVDIATRKYLCPLFDGNPHVGKVLALDEMTSGLPSAEYHAVIDLRLYVEHAENSRLHRNRAQAFATSASLDLSGDDLLMDYFVTEAEKDWAGYAQATRTQSAGLATVGFVWRTSTKNRTWAESRAKTILAALAGAGYRVLVFDHEAQNIGQPHALIGNCTGRDSIRQTAALINDCDVVIAPDSGLFHVASALRKPIVAYFGAFPIEERQTHTNIKMLPMGPGGCHFKPCRQYYCMNFVEDGTSRCIASDPQAVVREVAAILSHNQLKMTVAPATSNSTENVPTPEMPAGKMPVIPSFHALPYRDPAFFH